MQPPFRSYRSLIRRIRAENRLLHRRLNSRQLATVEAGALREVDAAPTSGSKPLHVLETAQGSRFVFKRGELALLEAEVVAHRLRDLAKRPSVPAQIREVTLNGATLTGLLKPFVEYDPERELPPDTAQWTDLQRHVMLMEHAWEWFLDNLDTNCGQFALLGDSAFPVNIDWDRSFAQQGEGALSRFAKYKGTLPSARTFLYADYVEGRIDLRLGMLIEEARVIRKLPKAEAARVLSRYASVRFETLEARARFVSGVLAKQVHAEKAFRRFARSLIAERKAFAKARRPANLSFNERLIIFRMGLWNRTQHAWHSISRGAPGRLGRSALKAVRRLRLGTGIGIQPSQPVGGHGDST
ncbi:MAG: hypothetical protein R3B07_11960 [Polyangiaceae bacterium]